MVTIHKSYYLLKESMTEFAFESFAFCAMAYGEGDNRKKGKKTLARIEKGCIIGIRYKWTYSGWIPEQSTL